MALALAKESIRDEEELQIIVDGADANESIQKCSRTRN